MTKPPRRATPPPKPPGRKPRSGISVRLFISYSHVNRVWMERLQPILRGFKYDDRLTCNRVGLDFVHAWHDNELTPGNAWDAEIKSELERMDIFVPLVSADFFASGYIQEVELRRARERHPSGELLVVPILLYESNLQVKCEFLHQFSAFPKTDRWWNSFPDYCEAHRLIDDGLWGAINDVVCRKGARPRV